ncbi:uncharacterized protein [Narcine bancroftii]|uniref:uncharacterized protein isoform X2 n=1 Tax=Narcine bancroftii TaxID=1343680 RepID=UPI003831949B
MSLSVSTTKMQSRKRSSEQRINESPPKRKKTLLSPYSGVSPAHSMDPVSTCKIVKTPVPNRMNTGHFSAWGVEDGQILYYMQRTGDSQSVGSAIISTPWKKESKSSKIHWTNSKKYVEQSKRSNASSLKKIQTKKSHYPCAPTTGNSETNPKTMFCSHFSKRLVNMPEVSFPKETDDWDGKNAPDPSDTWTCDTCFMLNKDPAVQCRGCETLKYGVGLERQWIPAFDTSCKEIQTNELSVDMCMAGNSTAATPLITDGAEGAISSASLMTVDINTEEKKTMEHLPNGIECTAILQPTEQNPAIWMPHAFSGIETCGNLLEATLSQKPTQQDVRTESVDQNKCKKEGDNSLNPDEPTFQSSLACISFPYVFGPLPIYTTCSSAVPLTLNVPAVTRSNMATLVVQTPPLQVSSFLPGNSQPVSNSNPSFGMFHSSGIFPSICGQTASELFPVKGGAHSGITMNPSMFPSAGPSFQFSGNLVPDCNFGCSTNNTIFRFEGNSNNCSLSHELCAVSRAEAPGMLNSVQPSGISYRRIKTAVRKRRPKYRDGSAT